MDIFWQDWQQPWTDAQCARRYVEGPRTSVRKLSEASGIPRKTLERWCTDGEWLRKREEFYIGIEGESKKKAIAKISDKLSDQLSELSLEHFEGYKKFRHAALAFLDRFQQEIDAIADIREFISKLPAKEFNMWSLAYDRSVKGEREIVGLHYEDINNAIAILNKHGYKIVDPTALDGEEEIDEEIEE